MSTTNKNPAGKDESFRGIDLSDDANAQRFVADHSDRLRYRTDTGWWMQWSTPEVVDGQTTGGLWNEVRIEQVQQLARQTAQDLEQDAAAVAAQIKDVAVARRIRSAGTACRSRARINAMIELARGARELASTADDWNRNPWLLNVANGTLDLKEGVLLPHRPEHLLSVQSPIVYDPTVHSTTWATFLDQITCGDTELAEFLQRAVGSSITGSVRDQVVFVLHGSGRNGKSTFLEILLDLVGPALGIRSERQLLIRRPAGAGGGPSPGLADLHGRRIVVATETDQRDHLDEALIKDLSGGERLRARQPFGQNVEFAPTHHIWWATNHLLRISGTDNGIWRRIRLIPFNAAIADDAVDPELLTKLRDELPGILTWAVEGCRRWQQQGLGTCKAIEDATAGYRSDQDVLGQFLTKHCVVEPDATVTTADLYDAYRDWALAIGLTPTSLIQLGRLLANRPDLTSTQLGQRRDRGWTGIRLRRPDDADATTSAAEGSDGLQTAEPSATDPTPPQSGDPRTRDVEPGDDAGSHVRSQPRTRTNSSTTTRPAGGAP